MVNHDILHWYRVGYRYLGYRGISADIPREPEIDRLETEHNDTMNKQGTNTQCGTEGTERNGTERNGTSNKEHRNGTE